MLFMGEEWAADQPFPFFCAFGPELAEAVRNGRRAEFARFPEFQDPASRERIPDPTAPETFASAKLDWAATDREPHADWLDWYRRVLGVRHAEIVPRLQGMAGGSGRYERLGETGIAVAWTLADGSRLHLRANLSSEPLASPAPAGRTLWQEGRAGDGELGPWTVAWSLESR
jgi:1,4-alpha-glucan branching enzyme